MNLADVLADWRVLRSRRSRPARGGAGRVPVGALGDGLRARRGAPRRSSCRALMDVLLDVDGVDLLVHARHPGRPRALRARRAALRPRRRARRHARRLLDARRGRGCPATRRDRRPRDQRDLPGRARPALVGARLPALGGRARVGGARLRVRGLGRGPTTWAAAATARFTATTRRACCCSAESTRRSASSGRSRTSRRWCSSTSVYSRPGDRGGEGRRRRNAPPRARPGPHRAAQAAQLGAARQVLRRRRLRLRGQPGRVRALRRAARPAPPRGRDGGLRGRRDEQLLVEPALDLPRARGPRRLPGARFFTVSVVAFLFAATVLELLVSVAGVEEILAQAISIVVATPLNFIGNKMWSFAHRALAGLTAALAAVLAALLVAAGGGRGGRRPAPAGLADRAAALLRAQRRARSSGSRLARTWWRRPGGRSARPDRVHEGRRALAGELLPRRRRGRAGAGGRLAAARCSSSGPATRSRGRWRAATRARSAGS